MVFSKAPPLKWAGGGLVMNSVDKLPTRMDRRLERAAHPPAEAALVILLEEFFFAPFLTAAGYALLAPGSREIRTFLAAPRKVWAGHPLLANLPVYFHDCWREGSPETWRFGVVWSWISLPGLVLLTYWSQGIWRPNQQGFRLPCFPLHPKGTLKDDTHITHMAVLS